MKVHTQHVKNFIATIVKSNNGFTHPKGDEGLAFFKDPDKMFDAAMKLQLEGTEAEGDIIQMPNNWKELCTDMMSIKKIKAVNNQESQRKQREFKKLLPANVEA